jgi:hypothetical protein
VTTGLSLSRCEGYCGSPHLTQIIHVDRPCKVSPLTNEIAVFGVSSWS